MSFPQWPCQKPKLSADFGLGHCLCHAWFSCGGFAHAFPLSGNFLPWGLPLTHTLNSSEVSVQAPYFTSLNWCFFCLSSYYQKNVFSWLSNWHSCIIFCCLRKEKRILWAQGQGQGHYLHLCILATEFIHSQTYHKVRWRLIGAFL